MTTSPDARLTAAAAEIEAHLNSGGWDQRPMLYALVSAERFTADDPALARTRGIDAAPADSLVPVEQEPLADTALDDALARIEWPATVVGCALSQEIVMLPPAADDGGPALDAEAVAARSDHREARLVVVVGRDGARAAVLRVRGIDAESDGDLLTGPDLAPNLAEALALTFS